MADIQTERAYQKQPTIFQNKRVLLGKTGKEKLPRYYKNIGLGFKTPKEAIEGTYIDKKCPFTVVTKMKMQRTIVIPRDYLHYIRKYNCFEKRHKNMSISDIVTVRECRPLSKTVRFNVLKVTKAAAPRSSSRSSETGPLPAAPNTIKIFSPSKKKKNKNEWTNLYKVKKKR
ncbi:hypothetical protein FD754_017594 [Muntiacus muntjak]|uniref:Small ribosomal subunit protein uS17 n=1 Tax=Muntiacus muntjak TaxID=9888 RepID=A0A5N3VUD0_MUNMU|nr:hypothetical protein FD754_017594 [Muntiacus muntjak]